MCEKQETFGGWCVSVGGESVDWKNAMNGKRGRFA